jgi:hypothetical protein
MKANLRVIRPGTAGVKAHINELSSGEKVDVSIQGPAFSGGTWFTCPPRAPIIASHEHIRNTSATGTGRVEHAP